MKINRKKLVKIFVNKWVLVTLFVLVFQLFFTEYNIFQHVRLRENVKELQKDKKYYLDEIKKDSLLLKQLENPNLREKYGREHYLMKKDNEDIWLIVDEKQVTE
jgi:cell division protein FtsB